MSDIKSLLEYQKIDLQILRIKSEVEKSEERKSALAAQKAVVALMDERKKSESAAANLLDFYNRSAAYTGENVKKIEELEKRLENAEAAAPEFERLADAVRSLYNTFSKMESGLGGYSAKIADAVKRFYALAEKRKQGIAAYKERRAKYDRLEEARRPEIEALRGQLAAAEKGVDRELFAKYEMLRADKKMPAAVPLIDKSCGGCSMEMSLAVIDRIKTKGCVECDNCRRIIYKA
jgi:predicted  nucleic acid-binding Zn-ribbon protein